MGDMKTPDFDDLLAAFDIPDIDAKEAIQSSPEEERDEAGAVAADGRESGSPSCFPCSPVSHSDRPVVSVIVKNTGRSEEEEEDDKSLREKTYNLTSSDSPPQAQVKLGEVTSQLDPKLPADGPVDSEPHITNGCEEPVPRDQEAGSTQPWSLHSPLRLTLNDKEVEGDKRSEVGSIHQTADVMNSLKPLLFPHSPSAAHPSSSTTPSPHSVSPPPSPHSPQKDEACLLGSSSTSSLPQNGSVKAGAKHVMHSDDEDSEPDLGSPLVIQESPESLMSSPPKFKLRSELLGSAETTSGDISEPPRLTFSPASSKPNPLLEDRGHDTTANSPSVQPHNPESHPHSVRTASASVQEEKYPEHVIDERDSPESPPPSETGLLVPNRSSSPDLAKTLDLAVNHKDVCHQEELMESESSRDDRPSDTEKMTEDAESVNKENNGDGTSSVVSASALETDSSPLRPIKVKIKMSTGSITRTVTGMASKRNAKAASNAVDASKPPLERHSTKPKRESQSQQDADASMPEGASAVKQKAAANTKPKVSPTAVSITKTTALPSVTSPKASPSGLNLRSLGQKTLNSGTLPSPSPLLTQSGSRPASIVNSTGAIISKSQTNLVEAFNKILNNKNLLPSYKPDLSAPLPAEWGISLPAQVIPHLYRYLIIVSLIFQKCL